MKKKARPVVLTVRLSEEEHRIFKDKAKKRGLTVASFIRTVALGAAP
jgi:predicted DNA binding CopG/RHH family protein